MTSHRELLHHRTGDLSPLHLAAFNGHLAVVGFLLDSGYPINTMVTIIIPYMEVIGMRVLYCCHGNSDNTMGYVLGGVVFVIICCDIGHQAVISIVTSYCVIQLIRVVMVACYSKFSTGVLHQ